MGGGDQDEVYGPRRDGRLLLVPGADKGAIAERPDIVRPAVIEFFTSPDASTTM